MGLIASSALNGSSRPQGAYPEGRGIARLLARITLSFGAVVFSLTAPALAQDVTFKGKTVTLTIGSTTGGGLDLYGRLVSRYFSKHIPGNPTVVLSYMPGAGSNVAAIHLFTRAPKDGTEIAVVFPSVLVEPLLNDALRKDYDPTKFNYIGNANGERPVCVMRKDAGFQSLTDFKSKDFNMGSTAGGSPTFDFPTVEKGVLGTRLKIISGYKGAGEVLLAIERNEVNGMCGLGWSTLRGRYPEILSGNLHAVVIGQEDPAGHPELNAAGVPLVMSLATTDAEKQALTALYAQNSFSRPFILPPGVEPAKIAAMRKAFMETMNDPELLAEAAQMKTDVGPSTGEEVQALIDKMYATPVDQIEQIKKALGRVK